MEEGRITKLNQTLNIQYYVIYAMYISNRIVFLSHSLSFFKCFAKHTSDSFVVLIKIIHFPATF